MRGLTSLTLGLLTIGALTWATPSQAITCAEVRELTKVYFKMHFTYHSFDDELSRRTLDNFVKAWDPGKVYFLKADVDEFRKKYGTKLDQMLGKANCKAIDDVVNTYSKRYAERQLLIKKMISSKWNFNKEEYMEIDRKKMEYAKTTEQIAERWRKRIKFQALQLNSTIGDIKEVRSKLRKRYSLATKRHNELTSDDVYAVFLNAFSASLDPHSEYYNPEQLEDFRIQTRLSLEGIGAVLRSEDGFTTIQSLVPGGAAWNSGKIKVDDKIIAVGQGKEPPVDVIDMDLREVVKLIRGARGTEVRLTVVRQAKDKTTKTIVPIIREKIQLQDRAAKSWVYNVQIDEAGGKARKYKLGVVNLPSFYMDFEGRQNREKNFKSSSKDMRNEITKLKKQNVDAVIVDLRSNGGGSLDESINIAGLFFDKGPVVQIKAMDGSRYVQEDKDGVTFYDGPLLVMINRQSASASEIFAGAIQDYDRGIIIGDSHTFGKGTVQNLNDIDQKLGAIKVTISKFYRPSGSSTQLKGVEADLVLPSISDEYEIGEKFYDFALPWEEIAKSKYKKFSLVSPYRKQLMARSSKRIKDDKLFSDLEKDIVEYRKNEKERSRVSLMEKKDEEEEKKSGNKDEDEEAHTAQADQEPKLDEDAHLQETLRVAADYVQLLNNRKLGNITLMDLKPVSVADKKSENKTKKMP